MKGKAFASFKKKMLILALYYIAHVRNLEDVDGVISVADLMAARG
jgi:hypothetical protein